MGKLSLPDPDKEQLAQLLSGMLVCVVIMALLAMVSLIVSRGLSHFWVQEVYFVSVHENAMQSSPAKKHASHIAQQFYFATIYERKGGEAQVARIWLQESTYRLGRPSQTGVLARDDILYLDRPINLAHISMKDGTFLYAIPKAIETPEAPSTRQLTSVAQYSAVMVQVTSLLEQQQVIQRDKLANLHTRLAKLRLDKVSPEAPTYVRILSDYFHWEQELQRVQKTLQGYQLTVALADGREVHVPLAETRFMLYPNSANLLEKIQHFALQLGLFISESPKLSNSAGGVFPALFGTVLMVMLMTLMVTPLGVLAAIYLAEYAPNNTVVSVVRISVSNLAGVPSIVYGVFGLGFFVYTVGGYIDDVLYSDNVDMAVFGAPGLLWASLTMALLTLPVVIVATEEGLRRVPNSLRQGSYALGATKFETLWRTVLPFATPGIMTGVILAIARGAGEVAPLLMLGAVKYAALLPVDLAFPYLHLERQFMHLGVLIYDGAFQSQYAGQEAGLMFAACMLLLMVVLVLNTIAVRVRNRLRSQYQVLN